MTITIARLLRSPQYAPKLNAITNRTSAFLFDPNKEARYKAEGLEPDPVLLDQYQIFDTYAPIQTTELFKFEDYEFQENFSIASITTIGQEIPVSEGGDLFKIEGGMVKTTLGLAWDEQKEMDMYDLAQRVQLPTDVVDRLFGAVDSLQPRVMRTANVMTCQAWYQGQIRYVDPRTNVGVNVKYNVYPELFPRALTGNDAWNRPATANGIQNLIDHWSAYYRISGCRNPDMVETVMSWDLCQDLLRQSSTADYARSLGLIATPGTPMYGPTMVDYEVLNKLAEKMRFPKSGFGTLSTR